MSWVGKLRRLFAGGRAVVFGLPREAATLGPVRLFDEWLRVARESGISLPEAVTLATTGREGHPAARMVLLKQHDETGFVFYTNLSSRKSLELLTSPHAALVFYWGELQRQVRVEGVVVRTSREEDRAYFRTRPRGSQIGAWASRQSEDLPEAGILRENFAHYEKKFQGQEVPLPEFWGGFRLVPSRLEFWQGRANRLHDRLLFTRVKDGWSSNWLYP